MPVELLRRGLERFGPIFIQGYGQTESGPLATVLTPAEHDPGAEHLASAGRAVPGVEVRIEDGEILIRSPFNMTGYWRNPELTAESPAATAGCTPATSAGSTSAATCTSSTARRT